MFTDRYTQYTHLWEGFSLCLIVMTFLDNLHAAKIFFPCVGMIIFWIYKHFYTNRTLFSDMYDDYRRECRPYPSECGHDCRMCHDEPSSPINIQILVKELDKRIKDLDDKKEKAKKATMEDGISERCRGSKEDCKGDCKDDCKYSDSEDECSKCSLDRDCRKVKQEK